MVLFCKIHEECISHSGNNDESKTNVFRETEKNREGESERARVKARGEGGCSGHRMVHFSLKPSVLSS